MKKLLFAFLISFTLVSVSYADFSWYGPTHYIFHKINDADKVYTSQYGGFHKIRYDEKFLRLERNIDNVRVINKGGYLQVNKEGENDGQCVSFVKALTNIDKATASWIPSKQVGVDSIQKGKAIAVFDSRGKYAGHTGIYIGSDSDGIWIFDQNWSDKVVAIHKIKFKNKANTGYGKGNGDKNNAYSYFTFK